MMPDAVGEHVGYTSHNFPTHHRSEVWNRANASSVELEVPDLAVLKENWEEGRVARNWTAYHIHYQFDGTDLTSTVGRNTN